MDEKKKISPAELDIIVAEKGFNRNLLTKDYYLTEILFLLKDVEGIYFKGGTALQKIFLDYSRLSEDADYTVTRPIDELRKEIETILNHSGSFTRIEKDKDVGHFLRMLVFYKNFQGEEDVIFIDLNKKAKLLAKPEKHKINHFYQGFIPEFSVNTLSADEMIAEKMEATIGRNKPRDHFDMYKIIKKGININLDYVKEKCRLSGIEFDIVKMFNNAQKLKRKWDEDMIPLLAEEITFQEVITTLAKHFNLKQEKENKKEELVQK